MNDDELQELLDRTAAAVGERLDILFRTVNRVRIRVDDIAARAAERNKPLDRGALATIRPLLQDILREDEPILEGVGIAVGRQALADATRWLEWWRRDSADDSHFVRHVLNPDAVGFYDYQSRDWFVRPLEHGRPIAIGPYVDAGGIDVCTVTLAIPLPLATGDAGVVGGDLSVSHLERFLLRHLATRHPPIALVGANDRIIASNSARHTTGSRFRPEEDMTHDVRVPCADPDRLGWRLLAIRETP